MSWKEDDVPLIDLSFVSLERSQLLLPESTPRSLSPFTELPMEHIEEHPEVPDHELKDVFEVDVRQRDSSGSLNQFTPRSRPRAQSSTSRHLHLTRGSSSDPAIPQNDEGIMFSSGSGSGRPFLQPCCSAEVNRVRWRIRFFFMDPIQKWRHKHQFPWKLFLQVIKIIFVTIQLVILGNERYTFATFLKQNTVSFRHLLLQNWNDPDIPVAVYPNTGLYAVYTKQEFYEKVDFAVNQFVNMREVAIGSYHYAHSPNDTSLFRFCKREFMDAHIFPQNHSFVYDSEINETCVSVNFFDVPNGTFSIQTYLSDRNASLIFDQLIDAKLLFTVRSVALQADDPEDEPGCYVFDVIVYFDNTGHNGQIPVNLDMDAHVVPCNGKLLFDDTDSVWDILVDVLDASILVVCIASLLLCLRALYNAEVLKGSVIVFFRQQLGVELTKDERMEFINLWYVMIVVNDILTICGTVVKLRISSATITELSLYNACGMLLGIGNLLVWFGVLRYLGFFKTYNILILTVKRALPNVMRYLTCTLFIFCGFSFCGWIILGPYHVKFQTFHSTTETIFSLINGDDMFATFAILPFSNTMIWYFSRLYLYVFICMFTYVVLSLMISLIMDAYGTVKDYYEQGGPSSRLADFLTEPMTVPSETCPRHANLQRTTSLTSFGAPFVKQESRGIFKWLRKFVFRDEDEPPRNVGGDLHNSSWIPHQPLHNES
ncbi:hypothetical protein RvY_00426-1 [Ramazzottius varieornatus]|uniref:Uncharacterized protein n=1 Tax=Ramazzottius varieornatus TaxID=947166 RepID=A0A1D1UJ12_RAMVA|nr:hypothetical protein RvY_00426-2 [Ramazzottius varieornatus]GAU87602.1 hypothetical protein RvY_00426-1 [Ramazzottius varieornatus]